MRTFYTFTEAALGVTNAVAGAVTTSTTLLQPALYDTTYSSTWTKNPEGQAYGCCDVITDQAKCPSLIIGTGGITGTPNNKLAPITNRLVT